MIEWLNLMIDWMALNAFNDWLTDSNGSLYSLRDAALPARPTDTSAKPPDSLTPTRALTCAPRAANSRELADAERAAASRFKSVTPRFNPANLALFLLETCYIAPFLVIYFAQLRDNSLVTHQLLTLKSWNHLMICRLELLKTNGLRLSPPLLKMKIEWKKTNLSQSFLSFHSY